MYTVVIMIACLCKLTALKIVYLMWVWHVVNGYSSIAYNKCSSPISLHTHSYSTHKPLMYSLHFTVSMLSLYARTIHTVALY